MDQMQHLVQLRRELASRITSLEDYAANVRTVLQYYEELSGQPELEAIQSLEVRVARAIQLLKEPI